MTLKEIEKEIENYFEINLKSRGRKFDVIKVRFFYYYCCFMYSTEYLTYDKVGSSIGFNHATVIYGLKEFKNIYNSDNNFKYHCSIVENIFIEKSKNNLNYDIDENKQDYIKQRIEFFTKYLKK